MRDNDPTTAPNTDPLPDVNALARGLMAMWEWQSQLPDPSGKWEEYEDKA